MIDVDGAPRSIGDARNEDAGNDFGSILAIRQVRAFGQDDPGGIFWPGERALERDPDETEGFEPVRPFGPWHLSRDPGDMRRPEIRPRPVEKLV